MKVYEAAFGFWRSWFSASYYKVCSCKSMWNTGAPKLTSIQIALWKQTAHKYSFELDITILRFYFILFHFILFFFFGELCRGAMFFLTGSKGSRIVLYVLLGTKGTIFFLCAFLGNLYITSYVVPELFSCLHVKNQFFLTDSKWGPKTNIRQPVTNRWLPLVIKNDSYLNCHFYWFW